MCTYTQTHHLLCGCRTYRVFRSSRCNTALRNGYDCPKHPNTAVVEIEVAIRYGFCQEGFEEEALVTDEERAGGEVWKVNTEEGSDDGSR